MVFRFASMRFMRIVVPPLLVVFLTTPLWTQTRQAQQRPQKLNVAVLDFDARAGISAAEAATLSDAFSAQLVETGEFTVVDRNRIKAVLQEQGFQQTEACSQVECVVEAGRILNVQRMFAGTIGKIGRTFNVTVQVIDVETAQISISKSRQHSGAIEELLSDVIPDIAAEMSSELTGKRVRTSVATTSTGTSWLWYALGTAVIAGGGVAAYVLLAKKEDKVEPSEPLPSPPPFPGN
ncbi:MAG TPA: CsgG/HfaB family protein [Bacteroidota bacterium]|nr:CsgG/HfaB family protein [Bacteroidota bacterium]